MPDITNLAKAELNELTNDLKTEAKDGKKVKVQFNPETLEVSFSNRVAKSDGVGDQSNPAALQFIGSGSTSLSVTLWFDVNAPQSQETPVDDVRKLTKDVVYFITPKAQDTTGTGKTTLLPPGVRFLWGSFHFDGIMNSITESLELFSSTGTPLRAKVTFSLSQQKIHFEIRDPKSGTLGPGQAVGTVPVVQAQAGVPLQKITDSIGQNVDWQASGEASGIENPRNPKAGTRIKIISATSSSSSSSS